MWEKIVYSSSMG